MTAFVGVMSFDSTCQNVQGNNKFLAITSLSATFKRKPPIRSIQGIEIAAWQLCLATYCNLFYTYPSVDLGIKLALLPITSGCATPSCTPSFLFLWEGGIENPSCIPSFLLRSSLVELEHSSTPSRRFLASFGRDDWLPELWSLLLLEINFRKC